LDIVFLDVDGVIIKFSSIKTYLKHERYVKKIHLKLTDEMKAHIHKNIIIHNIYIYIYIYIYKNIYIYVDN